MEVRRVLDARNGGAGGGEPHRAPDHDRPTEKAGDRELDFALMNRIAEIDRDADRRYLFATCNIEETAEKGEPQSQSPR